LTFPRWASLHPLHFDQIIETPDQLTFVEGEKGITLFGVGQADISERSFMFV